MFISSDSCVLTFVNSLCVESAIVHVFFSVGEFDQSMCLFLIGVLSKVLLAWL